MRTHRALLGAAAVALLASTPAVAAPARPRVVLSGRTVVNASGSGYLRVHLPRPARLSGLDDRQRVQDAPNHDVQISGRGRVTGFVLTRYQPSSTPGDRPATFVALQYGMCSGRACAPSPKPVLTLLAYGDGATDDGTTITLPRGDYTLHVVADGAPVRIVLDFPNQPGDKRVTVPRSEHVTVSEAVPDGRGRYTAAGTLRFDGLAIVAGAALARSERLAGAAGGFCVVGEDPASEHPTDPADPFTGCTARYHVEMVPVYLGQEFSPYYGMYTASHVTNAAEYPGGDVSWPDALPRGTYRYGQDYVLNPTVYEHALLLVAIPMR